jgi:hypothetical protein
MQSDTVTQLIYIAETMPSSKEVQSCPHSSASMAAAIKELHGE